MAGPEYVTLQGHQEWPGAAAVRVGDMLYLSGDLGVDENGKLVPGGIQAEAMQTAINSAWRPNSELRVIVVMSDHAAYPEEVNMTLQLARRFAAQQCQKISAVMVRGAADAAAYMPRLAEAGNGSYVRGGGSITATIIEALLKS